MGGLASYIAWAITGAGHRLSEIFKVMRDLKASGVGITVFLSAAAKEVVRMYGLEAVLREVASGAYYEEVLTDEGEGASKPTAARLARGAYKVLVVAPATANTVAKIVHGIADNLVTNAVAHAQKGGVPILILPTDQKQEVETFIPVRVERGLCRACEPCVAREACPNSAFLIVEGRGRIDLLKCAGCLLCVKACPFEAVKRGVKLRVRARGIDLENVEKLRRMRGVKVLENPGRIKDALSPYLKTSATGV